MGSIVFPAYIEAYSGEDTSYSLLSNKALYSFTRSYSQDSEHLRKVHPFTGFFLDRDDVEDKSKTDWLLRALAVVQISWLIVTVIVRGAVGLSLTQLELSTAAISTMAVFTYAAYWWKPKDIVAAPFSGLSSRQI
jgi:hypothetical protein